MLGPNKDMHKVIHVIAQNNIRVAGYLDFSEPSVISKARVAKPIDEVVGAIFLWNEGYYNARLRKEATLTSSEGRTEKKEG